MNIALTGMMGAGKSAVGNRLSKILTNYTFIDTDEEIVKSENKSINEIFSRFGEEYFRKTETKILKNILNSNNQIISTGGGIVISEENIRELRQKSYVIYLKADFKTLFERVKNNKERPLLNVDNMEEKINLLLCERELKYQKCANKIINTKNKTIDEISLEIAKIAGITDDYDGS